MSDLIALVLVLMLGLSMFFVFIIGEEKGRIDVASGDFICERIDTGRDTYWECVKNETKKF